MHGHAFCTVNYGILRYFLREAAVHAACAVFERYPVSFVFCLSTG